MDEAMWGLWAGWGEGGTLEGSDLSSLAKCGLEGAERRQAALGSARLWSRWERTGPRTVAGEGGAAVGSWVWIHPHTVPR